MTTNSNSTSRPRLLVGLAIAVLLALVALFTIVLPVERGYDPTGIGKALGLTKTAADPSIDEVIDDVLAGNENLVVPEAADPDIPIPLPNPAISQVETGAPHTETLTIKLGVEERTEIKALMGKSKVIVYNWSVEGGSVYVDFHGHDPSKSKNFWVRYEEADGATGRGGSLVAPFAGEHGWYWLNNSDKPVTITLTVTGYQEKMVDHGLF